MDEYLTINSELSNPTRLQILSRIGENPQTLSEIATHFSISKPEISRHLSRLTNVGIVTKEVSTRKYMPSALGEIYLQLYSPIEFVLKHSTYFTEHHIDLPLHLSRNIDALMNAELVIELGNVLAKIQEMLDETIDEVKLMLDQRLPVVGLKEKVKFGDYIVPTTMSGPQFESGRAYLKKMYESVEVRQLNFVTHIIMCTDKKRGFISFPTLQRKADWSSIWVVTDKLGLDYLKEIWNHFQGLATKIKI
ncbi:MAG: ArsR family transcriptional regulator [Candidatus Hodarchaeota archaeon]